MNYYELSMVVMAGGSLFLNCLVAVVGLTWGVGKVRDGVHREMAAEMQALEHSIGQTFTAIRTKVQEVELYMRDNYVRRDSFQQNMSNFSDEMRGNFAKMDARLERMENKIDGAGH